MIAGMTSRHTKGMNFKFLDHTADAKFQAFGKTKNEAFANAALAVTSVLIDPSIIALNKRKPISVKGKDEKALLYNFLEELLFIRDSFGFITGKIDDLKITESGSEFALTAVALGDVMGEKYETSGDVKAITYNQMEIVEEHNEWTVQVVIDI